MLISRLNPSAQRIDGKGGDGGRDVQMPTDEGLVLYQLKSFDGRMERPQRRQEERSLARAAQLEPIRWCLVVRIDPTPGELEWFEALTEAYGFDCEWLDRTQDLDLLRHRPFGLLVDHRGKHLASYSSLQQSNRAHAQIADSPAAMRGLCAKPPSRQNANS